MDVDGKGPDLVENPDRQRDASEAAADEFARDAAGQAIASSSADTAQDEPGQVAAEPARDAIAPRPLRLAMMAALLATAAALGSFVGSLSAGGVSQFWAYVRKRPMPNPRSRHTSRARLTTPITSLSG